MKMWSFLLLLWALPGFANSWQASLLKLLPEKMNTFVLNKTTLDQVKASLGPPALIRGEKHYWVYQGFEYALELKVIENKVTSIHFIFPKKAPSIDVLKLDPKSFKASSSHRSSRFMDYHDVGGSITIDLTTQTISIIRVK